MYKVIKTLANEKNKVFLITCLCVHLIYFGFYLCTGSMGLAVLNILSSCIYIVLLLTSRKGSSTGVVIAFFEIMIFSILSELLTAGSMGYMYYPLGMVAVIFYLAEVKKNQIILLELIGVISTVVIFIIDIKNITIPIFPLVNYDNIRNSIILANILVALVNMLYVSFLYLEEQEKNRAALEYNLHHDQLTGLYNRRYFYMQIGALKRGQGEYGIALIDIDNFKSINDSYGHKAGDAALVTLSHILERHLHPKDVAVRWGGEEFIIFMPETDESTAHEQLTQILQAVRENILTLDGHSIAFTVTMGLSLHDDPAVYEYVINEADRKLYEGKNSGKNRIIT